MHLALMTEFGDQSLVPWKTIIFGVVNRLVAMPKRAC
jgi:hypothetical protein